MNYYESAGSENVIPLPTTQAVVDSPNVELEQLPNDLTRLIYLASLRDCNSGVYLHPHLSQRVGIERANCLLRACHNEVFRRLLITPLSAYAPQLEEYIRYSRTDRGTMLKNWESLQAYRATVPLHTQSIFSELFCLNIEAAIALLQSNRDGFSS